MRTLALTALAVAASSSFAQNQPLAASYTWSASGKEYALLNRPLEPVGPFDLGLFVGQEVNYTKATVWGPGLSYTFETKSGLFAGASVAVLFGPAKPDVAAGVTFGFRF